MADAADLVEVRHTLRQLVNAKATDPGPVGRWPAASWTFPRRPGYAMLAP